MHIFITGVTHDVHVLASDHLIPGVHYYQAVVRYNDHAFIVVIYVVMCDTNNWLSDDWSAIPKMTTSWSGLPGMYNQSYAGPQS